MIAVQGVVFNLNIIGSAIPGATGTTIIETGSTVHVALTPELQDVYYCFGGALISSMWHKMLQ